tara:strand:+ start:1198 stop:1518 length:321 start_codon:yes stop_codon:yes gene_type:complete
MSHSKFIENNYTDLTQLYIVERKRVGPGILLLDFLKQDEGNVNVSYRPLNTAPQQIIDQVMDKMENPIYDCTAYFCIITPSNECMLVDVNLDPHRDKAIDELNKMK